MRPRCVSLPSSHDRQPPRLRHAPPTSGPPPISPSTGFPGARRPSPRRASADRPVLLDIGAVWCHWCHVMDGESYEDPRLAEFLNEHFVCIKVDRDERPDVDARYQRAVQALTRQGGWPLTAFLTPAGEVFYGGTYFPPDGTYGRPGFRTVLEQRARRVPLPARPGAGAGGRHPAGRSSGPRRGRAGRGVARRCSTTRSRQMAARVRSGQRRVRQRSPSSPIRAR